MDNSKNADIDCEKEFDIYRQMQDRKIGPIVCDTNNLCGFYYLSMEKFTGDAHKYMLLLIKDKTKNKTKIESLYEQIFELIDKMLEKNTGYTPCIATLDIKLHNFLVKYNNNLELDVENAVKITDFSPSYCIDISNLPPDQINITKIMLKLQLYMLHTILYGNDTLYNIFEGIFEEYSRLKITDSDLKNMTNGIRSLYPVLSYYSQPHNVVKYYKDLVLFNGSKFGRVAPPIKTTKEPPIKTTKEPLIKSTTTKSTTSNIIYDNNDIYDDNNIYDDNDIYGNIHYNDIEIVADNENIIVSIPERTKALENLFSKKTKKKFGRSHRRKSHRRRSHRRKSHRRKSCHSPSGPVGRRSRRRKSRRRKSHD